jgi:hypothetical protein
MAKGQVIRGAPTVSHRTVISNTKSARYFGAEYPGSVQARRGEATMGRIFDVDAPTIGGVVSDCGDQADRRGKSKADEVAQHDPCAGLGANLDGGPLGRATRAGR